jgi:hypothetical protein
MEADLGPTANQHATIGRMVTLEKGLHSEVNVLINGAVVGSLAAPIGAKVVSAIDRGQLFSATIEKAFPIYDAKFKPTGAHLDIKVEYVLEKGQPAIETEKSWRCVDSPIANAHPTSSFFTNVAGVTFDGRQRIIAQCSVGERLHLRDPNNRFDKGAIKVLRSNGEQLGFVPAHVSRDGHSSGLAFRMDRGDKYICRISSLTGGGWGKSLGVNIEITDAEGFITAEASAVANSTDVAPGNNTLGWVILLIAIVLLLVVIVAHNS